MSDTSSSTIPSGQHAFDYNNLKGDALREILMMLDVMSDGIVYYNKYGKLTFYNKAFVEIYQDIAHVIQYGATFDAIFQAGLDADLWDLDGQTHEEYTAEQKTARAKDGIETLIRFKDGRYILRREYRTKNGGMIGIRSDVTELKQREAELDIARREAERADKAKSQFLANMSHEIRTPMNGVIGMAELLGNTSLDNRQKDFTTIIIKSGEALLTILNDILDFSKIDAEQMVLNPTPFNLREALEDVATLVSPRAVAKNIELALRIDSTVPHSIIGDVGRIRQIVTNLVGNAVKFTDQGHVLIDVKNLGEDDGHVKFQVRVEDTGVGIPADKCDAVFEKFSQVDESARRRHEGTGLGLAISSSLIKLMGGEIGVESDYGKGSCFWFIITLPVDATAVPDKSLAIDFSGKRALIVDDNSVNRSILEQQLSDWGFKTETASSAIDALKIIKSNNTTLFDLFILDYQMPVIDGAALSKLIRDDRSCATTPIVMLTSVDHLEHGESFASLDIQGQLSKPARSNLLKRTIADALHIAIKDDLSETPPSIKNIPIECPENNRPLILIAEDNLVNQQVVSAILENANYNYLLAQNGIEAIELTKEHAPDIILMDVSMPELDGLTATSQIREWEHSTKSTQRIIIGVTAHAIDDDRERCLAAGMDDYLAKPISPQRLTDIINHWVKADSRQAVVK